MQSSRSQKLFVALVLVIGLMACRTSSIREPDVIPVPPGLTAPQVERAIALAIEHSSFEPSRPWVSHIGPLSFGGGEEARPKWFVEARNPGSITAACKKGDHYLQTMIRYNSREVRIEIVGSKNLLQGENFLQSKYRIHKNVYKWIGDLEFRIQSQLGKSVMRTD